MKIKREQGRFVLIENAGFNFPIAFYMNEIDKIAVCFGCGDKVKAMHELNNTIIKEKFLKKIAKVTDGSFTNTL